jgi:site-specific DNA recombinase
MTERAIIYARVSTDDQRGNYSIPTQVSEAMQYAKTHQYGLAGDWYIKLETGLDTTADKGAPAYVDDYTSRELNRPALDAALKYLETVGTDVVILHALDRLARDPYVRRTLEMEIERRGARVEYVRGGYDDSPEGEVRKDMDATFAKWENAKRVERSTRGKRGKAQRGLFVAGRAPFGYEIDGTRLGGLGVVPEQAAVVVRIFEMYVDEGCSIRQITETLSQQQSATWHKQARWAKSSVKRVLENETYAGLNYYNKYQRKGKRITLRDRAEWIPIPVTAVIARSLYDEAQAKLKHNRETRRRMAQRFYLLSGMVFCAECERVYAAQTGKAGHNRRANDAPAYRHRAKEGHCRNAMISGRNLEREVWETIRQALMEPELLREAYAQSLEQQQASQKKKLALLEQLERGKLKLEQKREKLTATYIDPDMEMSKADYLRQKGVIDRELNDVTERIDQARKELGTPTLPASLETLEKFASSIRRRLKRNVEPSAEEKRQLFEMLHIKVILATNGKRRVDGWFHPPEEEQGQSACLSRTTLS